jgi:hypothetical protein
MAGITKEERARRAAAKDAVSTPAAPSTSTEIPATTTGDLNLNPTGVTLQSDQPSGFNRTASLSLTPEFSERQSDFSQFGVSPETLIQTTGGEKPASELQVGDQIVVATSVVTEVETESLSGAPEVVTRPLTQEEIRRIQMAQCPIDKLHRNG